MPESRFMSRGSGLFLRRLAMLYVTVDSPVHRDQLQYTYIDDFLKWICSTYPGANLVFREMAELRVYYHRDTRTFIIVRGLM